MPKVSPAHVSPVVEKEAEFLVISSRESECESIRRVLGHPQSSVTWFPTCQAAVSFLREHPIGVVFCDSDMVGGCWRDLLDALTKFDPPPNLIVLSRLADERLWAEVLNLGGYDLLPTPFEPEEILRVTTGAWLAWKRRLTEVSRLRREAVSSRDRRPARGEELAICCVA